MTILPYIKKKKYISLEYNSIMKAGFIFPKYKLDLTNNEKKLSL